MAVFPSQEWFDQVREVFNTHEEYHGAGGGACDTTFAVKVGDDIFQLVMEGLECTSAARVDEKSLADVDFYLELEPEEWREMIENIKEHDGADLNWTLNTLDLDRDERVAKSVTGDQYREDLFFRFNQTLQFFFDASAKIDTEFGA
ncbi:MAG TPA: hypothetical protein VJ998_00045 [Pseudomonadales bacterium]|nr:hypothetical protein [Pseudomonadales bacterium]